MPTTRTDASAFAHFAATAEQAAETSKRLTKAALLARYFDTLQDADLAVAARYFAGHLFPLRDQRTTNVGGAAIMAAVLQASGANETWARQRLVALGDFGDLAGEAFAAAHPDREPAITLGEAARHIDSIAAAAGAAEKQAQLGELLSRATAPEARYLIKLLSGELRVGLQEGAVEDAVARWTGAPLDRVQWANMLTGDIGETAVLARHGRLHEARMRLFHPLKFMLATPAADLADVARQMRDAFHVEDKFDGIRAQAHIARVAQEPTSDAHPGALHGVVEGSVRVALFSRTLDEITQSFPDLVAPLAALAGSSAAADGLILDGEIVPVMGDRILPFQALQQRLGRKLPGAEVQERVPVAFVAYDLLYGDRSVRLTDPFRERRALLERLPVDGNRVRRADSTVFRDVAALDAEFEAARARGNEGLMVKDPASPYRPGRRGREWLKIKRAYATLDVVVTAAEVGNGRRSSVLSDYTFAVRASEQDPTLLNVGKAYSGLTDGEIAALTEWFNAHTLQEFAHGKVRLVEPRIVLEVTFDRVQESKRHKSGFALRFPRIVRVRDDKPPEEIDTLQTVERLARELNGEASASGE